MHYGEIKKFDIANGPGVRVSIFVSGCRHHCEGCFNPETWDFEYGDTYTDETKAEIMDALAPSFIQGLTVLGGEPFEPENQLQVRELLETVRAKCPDKDIWCYTGYTYEKDLVPGGSVFTEDTDAILECVDVLVDGEFVLAEKDITLTFRGSRNQRILRLDDQNKR